MTAPVLAPGPETSEREIVVNIGDFAVARTRGVLSTSGLGSCVAIVLFDARDRVAGLAHILLPDEELGRGESRPAKFPESAVPLLVSEMRRAGSTG